MIHLDLEKSATAFRLNLEKHGITPPQAEAAFVLDVSKSFDDEHREGITNDLMTRLVPWGMVFDQNGEIDVFTFSDGPAHACHVGTVGKKNYLGYVERHIVEKVRGYNGGTEFNYVLTKALEHFGWIGESRKRTPGFLAKLFGGAETAEPKGNKKCSIVIVVTDGQNSDEEATCAVLEASETRKDQVFFLFVGISNQEKEFRFLRRIGKRFANVGCVIIDDLRSFVEKSDDELNDVLLDEKLRSWLKN